MTLSEKKKSMTKKAILIVMMVILLLSIAVMTATATTTIEDGEQVDTFYNIRINYVFKDGAPAHDAYIATFREGDAVDITVTNPTIDGFVPMTAAEGGVSAATSTFRFASLQNNVTETVYYVAGMTPYRVMYYKQNLYDDLYTRNNNVEERYTNRYGYTGSNPTVLETEDLFEGFTNLFHEPDSIAADGSTVFRVYYDRNYYTVLFDLGEHGYGLEPVYAKYGSVYHITDPKRLGYTFKGWARTDADSTKGEYGVDWHYIDENGNQITPAQAIANAAKFYEGTIPAHNTYYKALWESGTTKYSVVYWIENADSPGLTIDDINETQNIDEARALIARNYSVAVARDIENVPSGTLVNLHSIIQNARGQDMELFNLFAYDLTNTTNFPMSDTLRSELVGKEKYYEFNNDLSMLQFNGLNEEDPEKEYIEVMGDGTTRINVYYDRKEFVLKFYYARQKLNNGVANGEISLTNSTKSFSNYAYYNKTNETYLNAVSQGTWQSNIADSLPQINSDLLTENGGPLTPGYNDLNGYRYYYYQVTARYNEPLTDKWRIDAITPVHKKGYADDQICYPGSWAVENGTYFYSSHTSVNNFTVKGVYDRLGDELMFNTNKVSNYQELHYLLSWTNTASGGWNYGVNRVLHFTYQNYVELLPREIDLMTHDDIGDGTPDGVQGLINAGLYEDVYELRNGAFTHIDPAQTFTYHADAVYYGLKPDFIIETIDSGDQYDRSKSESTRTDNVRSNQVPTELTGYKLINADNKNSKGQIILDNTNSIVDWSDDTDNFRHASVKFFYNRNYYKLKWRNGNIRVDAQERDVKYGAPLNSYYRESGDGYEAGDYRYWFSDPEYFNEDLRDYYTFDGWYYTPYYYNQVDKDTVTMPADDMTLYAKWVPKEINVSFYPTYNDFYADVHHLDEEEHKVSDTFTVNYGDYIPMNHIPADVEDEHRPKLTPPAEGAMFAGWYYLRNNIPVRFEPESIPVTALNKDTSVDHGHLRLYAEWVTKDVGKYKISYVERDNPDVEVAHHTVGRAFVWKTRTFNALSGTDLNEDHAWTEDGMNWWPTANSHSLVIRANTQGHEYAPNEYTFEYIQKHGVHYRVEYLDAVSRKPLLDPAELSKDDVYSTRGSVKEDAPFIPGYVAEDMSQTMILTASSASTAEEQRTEELETNVITFYYNKNDTEYLYEVEYYKQNIDDDDYTLDQTENYEIRIADDPDTPEIEPTTLAVADLFNTQYAALFGANGFTRAADATQVTVVGAGGTSSTVVADDARIPITATEKTTVKLYFDRNKYDYTVQYVDYHAEREYLDASAEEREGMWNGVMEIHHDSTILEKVEKEVTINAPLDLTYDTHPYTRINNQSLVLTIGPVTENNPNINVIKVYYKKFYERELQYKLVCVNNSELTDYDDITGAPLFGGLSSTDQTVENYDSIADVTFYNFNNAKAPGTNTYLHDHHYTFLGWYTTSTYDPDHPDLNRLTQAETLTRSALGLNESLPARDVTYYALVKQDTVKLNCEFRVIESDLPLAPEGSTEEESAVYDDLAAEIVEEAERDPNGDKTGSKFVFTDPSDYENNTEIMWRRSEGYSLSVQPKDNRVYKYEFVEWWEEVKNKQTGATSLYRHHNYNDTTWGASIERQLDRKEDKHLIAVFKRREVDELPYTINYQFKSRIGNTDEERTKTFVKKGTLYAENGDLIEGVEGAKITTDGDYRLTDSFILENSPFESNHGETFLWSNSEGCITKTSEKGADAVLDENGEEITSATVDTTIATITAKQSVKTVFANYRMNPDEAYGNEPIVTFYGANYALDEQMKALEAPASYNGMAFSYWAVRRSAREDADVVAKSYERLFDLCMMDNYWLTPVYEGAAAGPGAKSAALDVTTHNIAQGNEDWLAWTWNEGEDGVWVRPDDDLTFTGLLDKVKFARVPAGTSVTGGVWDETFEANVWNYTEDDDVDVQDGQTLTLTDYYHDGSKKIAGTWSNNELEEDPTETPAESVSAPKVTLAHQDYSRNRWTDSEGNIDPSGETDLLFADFEIAFEDNGNMIYRSDDYKTGVVLEYCATVPSSATFDPTRDYNQTTNYENLGNAVKDHLNGDDVNLYVYKGSAESGNAKRRTIQFCDIPTEDLTDHNRVQFGKYIYNAFTVSGTQEDLVYTYTNCNYLLKATAYLVDKDGNVTFSHEPVYVCYKNIASQNSALPEMVENGSN